MHDRQHNMLLAQKCSPSRLHFSCYLVTFLWGQLLYVDQHQSESEFRHSSKPAMVKSCFHQLFFQQSQKSCTQQKDCQCWPFIADHISFLCIQFVSLHRVSKPLFSRSVFFKWSFDAVQSNIIFNKICHLNSCWTKSKSTELTNTKRQLLLLLWCQCCF